MKVFEVLLERCSDLCREDVEEERHFVTSCDDSILSVANHFSKYCEEMDAELRCVREILTVTEHLVALEMISDTQRLDWLIKNVIEYKPARYDVLGLGRFDMLWFNKIADIREAIDKELERKK